MLFGQFRLRVTGVSEVVDLDGLVRKQRDQPYHLTEGLFEVLGGFEGFAEVFEAAVACSDEGSAPGLVDTRGLQ